MVLVLHPTFTGPALAAFFTDADQLNLDQRTVGQLAIEGIGSIVDLPDFSKDDIDSITRNFERPPRILNAAGNLVNQAAFTFPTKSQKRLHIGVKLADYYEQTNRVVTPDMMRWPVMKDFQIQMDALKETVAPPAITPIKTGMPITKFLEHFKLHCHGVIGKRNAPINYVFRDEATVPLNGPAFLANRPHSTEHGSVEGELIARLSFDHPLFRNDNELVYGILAKGLQGSKYAATIVRFRRNGIMDGRGAYLAVKAQHAGKAVWEAQIKKSEDFLKTRVWTGNATITLEAHVDGHRMAYVALTEASSHVAHQLPNERTRVTYLLDSMNCTDPELLAAVAAVKNDDPGMRDTFELTAASIGPADPVARKRMNSKRPAADISATEGLKSTGKTGVELRWHKHAEFKALPDDQREELKGWCATRQDNKHSSKRQKGGQNTKGKTHPSPGSNKYKKLLKREVKAATAIALKAQKSDVDTEGLISAIKALASAQVADVSAASAAPPPAASVTFKPPAGSPSQADIAEVQLRSILGRSKLGKKE